MLPLIISATTSGTDGSGGDTDADDVGARLPSQTEVWSVLFILCKISTRYNDIDISFAN